MSRRTLIAWIVLAGLLFAACAMVVVSVRAIVGMVTPEDPPQTLLLVSIDGFRHDYLDRYPAPTLQQIARDGVRAEWLIPSYPSVTFPNHYTLVTGLRPERHGMVGNHLYDPGRDATFNGDDRAQQGDAYWWEGEPIWATAERQDRRAFVLSWPGAEAPTDGVRPSRWSPFDGGLSYAARVDTVLAWLRLPSDQRPAFATLYFDGVDNAGHTYGPDAPETADAVAEVDRALARLLRELAQDGLLESLDLVIVSDHGMTEMRTDRVVFVDDHLDVASNPDIERILWDEPTGVWPASGRTDAVYQALRDADIPHTRVVRREDTPAHLHFRRNDRIAPILLMADEGWAVTTRARWAERDGPSGAVWGTHGFDPHVPNMGGLLLARGPSFREGFTVGPVENIHVYALMTEALGLDPAPHDGDLDAVRAFLR